MSEEWPLDEDRLRELYWNDGLSLVEIGERFDVYGGAVLYWMMKYGIERRDNMGAAAIPDDELIAELRAGAKALGRPPYKDEMDEFGAYCTNTYRRRFGSWLEALEAADLYVPDRRREYMLQETDASEGSV